MLIRKIYSLILGIVGTLCIVQTAAAQCGGKIMEPGFAFLSSSRGCAPFTAQIQTLYLASEPGTQYFVDWGDGTPEETYTQVNATGVNMSHLYPNTSVNCGYDVTIDAANTCNPRGSVVPISTQVIVWTNDVISINPAVYRVCQGTAANVTFTDNSDWNCYPRATRENAEGRWIQWIYGTGGATMIPGIKVNNITPGGYPYYNPAPGTNPMYPILSPGQTSLSIQVPVTTPADVGKVFEVTLKNWNQCNPYDNDLSDGNAFNPVNGDAANGDNPFQITTAQIVIVDAPAPTFATKLGDKNGPIQSTFCINDNIYFDNNTPAIAGASFHNTWEFYDNPTGTGVPVIDHAGNPTYSYATAGQKLVRLRVVDSNAAGTCEATYQALVTISPSLVAKIGLTDQSGNPIGSDFCQEPNAPLTNFTVRFNDVSVGTVTSDSRWRWEFYDEFNNLIREEPVSGAFSTTKLGPFDQVYTNLGTYRVKLIVRDNATACESTDEVMIRVFSKALPLFSVNSVCEGNVTAFNDLSTITAVGGQTIVLREWDMSYDGVTFTKDPTLDNKTSFTYNLGAAGSYRVALRVTTDLGGCSSIYEQTVIVDPMPAATFTADVTSGCSVLNVNLTNTCVATQPPGVTVKRYEWEINSGSGFQTDLIQLPTDPPGYLKKFVNTTLSNKLYDVRLRVITQNNCERVSAPVTITVFPGPRSGFIAANYTPVNDYCSPLTVNFSVDAETQSLNPTDYQWIVTDPDGTTHTTDTNLNANFSYPFVNNTQLIQKFSVTLRASLPSGCVGDSTRSIRINPVPSADFTITEIAPSDCDHRKYHIQANQQGLSQYTWKIDLDGNTVLSSIQLGDNFDYEVARTAADQNAVVSLTTTNLASCTTGPTTQSFVVPKVGNLTVAFLATPGNQTLPNSTVTLTNQTTPGPWIYKWKFGDGTTSADVNPVPHDYGTYGVFTITLTVSDGFCADSTKQSVTINPIPPVIDFDFDNGIGCAPLVVTFTNKSQFADPSTYVWDFGDGGASNQTSPRHQYNDPGTFTVRLSAANALGQVTTIKKDLIITVNNKPDAEFLIKPYVIYIPGGKLFTKNQSFGASSYVWDFGDGETSTETDPVHVYTEVGEYNVSMIATTPLGCADTAYSDLVVRVLKGGELLIPNAFSPNVGGQGGLGINDKFVALMRGVTKFRMMIFNRWGELLFSTEDQNDGWDGYYNGKLCQQDVYVYKIIVKYENGEEITKIGDVNLIR